MLVKIKLTIEKHGQESQTYNLRWLRKSHFSSQESATIPLFEKLSEILKSSKLVKVVKGQMITSEDPMTGEDVDDYATPSILQKEFSIQLEMEMELNLHEEIRRISRKYRLSYSFLEDYEYQEGMDDNYKVAVFDHMGDWI